MMRNFKGFVYFFQSGTGHSGGYFVECFFVTGEFIVAKGFVN